MTKTFTGNEGHRDAASELIFGISFRSTIKQQNLTVGTSATKLPETPLARRLSMLVFNNSTSGQILYIGNSQVTSTDGAPLYPRASMRFDCEDAIDIYGISSAAGADIRILEGS